MAACINEAVNLDNGLKHNFLYNNDINCIHILLNLYDLEDNIRNIFPKYVSIKNIKNYISKCLKDKRGNELIAKNLGELIHEDINRLELYLYLEGYKQGFYNIKAVNVLESITVKYLSIEELYSLKYLFHFKTNIKEVLELKEKINTSIDRTEINDKFISENICKYTTNIIRPKVYSLNKYLDKQLTIDYCSKYYNIKEDSSFLTKKDLKNIYNEVYKIVLKNGLMLYKDAYWNGVNDKVLKRYK
jgi:hypothetical protein